MSFIKKLWKDRVSEYPNRRTINDGYTTKRVTVGRDEGNISEEGTPFNAANMNDLEDRIFAAVESGGGGGGSGTYDYDDLENKPTINSVTLSGNKTTADLHISYNDLENTPNLANVAETGDYNDLINTPDLSVVDITSGITVTKTAGEWTVDSWQAYRTGNVIQLRVVFQGNGQAVSAGSNAINCTVSGIKPKTEVYAMGFAGSSLFIGGFYASGSLLIRIPYNTLTIASTSKPVIVFEFIAA
jgi:hypothetical protein